MITNSERDFLNHSSMFGTDSVVHKLGTKGRKWTVGYADCQHPDVFTTKKAAGEAASKWACAIALRKYEDERAASPQQIWL
jgi:hypothetical protein